MLQIEMRARPAVYRDNTCLCCASRDEGTSRHRNITLDGVIEATEGRFGPAGADADVDQSDVEAALTEQRTAADAFLVGRVTFEQMRGYWPQQTADTTGITDYLNTVS
jgi:hypothetical protein